MLNYHNGDDQEFLDGHEEDGGAGEGGIEDDEE